MSRTVHYFKNHHYTPEWLPFTRIWHSEKIGRFCKRQLSKARRRAWKYGEWHGLERWNRECNWKMW